MIADRKELKELNESLAAENDQLRKDKKKPKVIIQTVVEYRDTGSVNNTVSQLDDDSYSLDFSYTSSDGIIGIDGSSDFNVRPYYLNSDSTKFKLKVEPGVTRFDTISVNLGLTLGITEDRDGIDRVFAKPNPYSDKIVIKEIDAVQLEEYYKSKYNKKKKPFSVGPYVGLGIGIGNSGQFVLRPSVGVGVQWKLFQF